MVKNLRYLTKNLFNRRWTQMEADEEGLEIGDWRLEIGELGSLTNQKLTIVKLVLGSWFLVLGSWFLVLGSLRFEI